MELIRATENELEELLSFYRIVADNMEETGLQHWHWGKYPIEEIIREDLEKGNLYYLRDDGAVAAAVAMSTGQGPEYEKLTWTCGIRPGTFHCLAVHPSTQGAGLGGLVLDDVQQYLRRNGCDCVRCDTSVKNSRSQKLYAKLGFRCSGTMRWPDSHGENVIFDKPLKRETPLWPIRMVPAFRDGELTPWGGTRLQKHYGKDDADEHTGESLEVSCIPGLESRDPQGRTLPELIREFGSKLVGDFAEQPFPLLLKLIDARDRLSVQVHPDDEYAAARETGKLGKTEAWVILETPRNGGEIVYGIRPGATLTSLREACEAGSAVEPLLNRVKVFPGDVCYIPAGCVHAIGSGILLYEIQQSSDLTYRFYDWDRTDEHGKRRELHIRKALDVADLKCAPVPVRVEKSYGVKRVLSEKYFSLDLIRTDAVELLPALQNFGILTVTEGELALRWSGASIRMKAGDTCFLPCNSPELAVEGIGAAILAMPAEQ